MIVILLLILLILLILLHKKTYKGGRINRKKIHLFFTIH